MRNLLLFFSLLFCGTITASPVDDLLERIDAGASRKIITEVDPALGKDCFSLSVRKGKPVVKGGCTVSIAVGIHWYLKYYVGMDLSWNMMHPKLPGKLPTTGLTVMGEVHKSTVPLRYYLNYCTFSYSMAFWGWERWQEEIDWMAMHGINLCLSLVGTDAVWRAALHRLGYPDDRTRKFIAGPAFHAWWLMNNLEGWGGPESDSLIDKHEALQKKIVARMRELGIDPVLPGYCGMVPHDAREVLRLNVQDPGKWCAYDRPAFLQPSDPRFAEVAATYYDVLDSLYGKARYYSMDPFHEGGNTAGVDLKAAGTALWQAMKRSHEDAAWVIQAWGANPRKELMDGVPANDLIVLDLNAENVPQWGDKDSRGYRQGGFGHHPWIFCELLNFGGNTGLFGRIDALIDGYYKALDESGTMHGVGLTMEGMGNNEMMYSLMLELPWHNDRLTREAWTRSYAATHYGRGNGQGAVGKAWGRLASTIYNCPKASAQQGTTETVFCARPSDKVWQVSTWSNMEPYYNPKDVINAALEFAKGIDDDALMANDNYRYDLTDILRQGLAEKGRLVYTDMQHALENDDANGFRIASNRFLNFILLEDSLLATRREFMLGTWIDRARLWGDTFAEKNQMEWNARVQVTTWGNRTAADDGGLHDYAHKEWSGLLRDFYYMRWKRWIDNVGKGGQDVDWYAVEEPWTRQHNAYPTEPQGDLRQIARRVVSVLMSE